MNPPTNPPAGRAGARPLLPQSPHKSARRPTGLACSRRQPPPPAIPPQIRPQIHPPHPAMPPTPPRKPTGLACSRRQPPPPAFCHPAMPRYAGGSGTRSRSCRVFPPPSRLFCLAAGVVGGGAGKASWSRMATLTHPAALAAARRRAPPTHAASFSRLPLPRTPRGGGKPYGHNRPYVKLRK